MNPALAPIVEQLASRLTIRAEIDDVRQAAAWLAAAGLDWQIPPEALSRLDHCLDEVLANVIMHGGAGAHQSPVLLELQLHRCGAAGEAALTVSDGGIAFDPLGVVAKPRPTSLDEAEPGGLGLLMLRSNADRLSYQFFDQRNHLTFAVSWSDAT